MDCTKGGMNTVKKKALLIKIRDNLVRFVDASLYEYYLVFIAITLSLEFGLCTLEEMQELAAGSMARPWERELVSAEG